MNSRSFSHTAVNHDVTPTKQQLNPNLLEKQTIEWMSAIRTIFGK